MISNYTERLDPIMLEVFGDYAIEDFICSPENSYTVWIKEVPVKEVRS